MPVQYPPYRISNGLIHIVAIYENSIEGGNRTCRPRSCSLKQLGQSSKYRGRISPGSRRLADSQTDFTLSHRIRVTESIISMTFKPRSRKYSAIVVAICSLNSNQRGLVRRRHDDDRTCKPSGPRSFSMNSSTSRPRSPIRAMTLTSAAVFRAIIPSNVLLPTPEPAKMPTR